MASDAGGAAVTLGVAPQPLPAGMAFNLSTGEVSFRPEHPGSYTLTFSAETTGERVSETLTVTVPSPAPGAPTVFSGRVLDANSFSRGDLVPVVGATVSFLGSAVTATTDSNGNFVLTGLPAGAAMFDIDAAGANPAPGGASYGSFREHLALIPEAFNQEQRPFFLPRIEAASLAQVNPVQTTVVTNPRLGVTLTVPPNTAKNADGTPFVGQLSISEVPLPLAPVALPETFQPALLVTVQPVGVSFSSPVPISYPTD